VPKNPTPQPHKVGDKIRVSMQMHGGEIADAAINAALLTPTIAVVNQLSSEDHERSL
jgi:hypothetical protein